MISVYKVNRIVEKIYQVCLSKIKKCISPRFIAASFVRDGR